MSERNGRRIAVVLGRGASKPTARRFRDMALALPSHEIEVLGEVEGDVENGGAKLDHGSGGEVLLRAA